MQVLEPKELKNWFDENKDFTLVDVREIDELEICKINQGINIPLGELPQKIHSLDSSKPLVFICRSGKRSANACFFAQEELNEAQIYNLNGGMLAWIEQVDNSLSPY